MSRIGAVAGAMVLAVSPLIGTPALAADRLSVQEQNALIRKHCLQCHSDMMPLGALSVERLDVATAPDSLIAMLLSQISQHLPLLTVQSSHQDATARAAVAERMRRGAMTAAGVPLPPDETIHALIDALAARSRNARGWNVERGPASGAATDTVAHSGTVTVSTVREVLKKNDGPVPIYRLSATCNERTRTGELRLSWLPFPAAGTISLAADYGRSSAVVVEKETTSVVLRQTLTQRGEPLGRVPERQLVIRVPQGDAVEFEFATLPLESRRALAPCFVAE